MPFEVFPYTNFHELNLDWIVDKVHDLTVEYIKTQNELKAVEDDFVNLKNYVDNYFASTDFAELADQVLHEMLNNGELTTLFAQYTLRIYSNVAEMKADNLLIEGSRAKTLGYYYASDRGSASYFITSSTFEGFYETLSNGLKAYLVKEPKINMAQVGILPDTDVTNLLQNALSYYTDIEIPYGTYYTNGTLSVINDNTKINFNNAVFNQNISASGTFITCHKNNFVLENVIINYPTSPLSTTPNCVVLYQSKNSVIRNVKITKPFGIGIAIENSTDCRVQDCEVSYAQGHKAGLWIGAGVDHITVERLYSHHNDLDGIIADGTYQTIKNCHLAYNGQSPAPTGALGACGIYVDQDHGNHSRYMENLCEYNTESGFDLKGRFIEVAFNKSYNNGLSGIVIRDFTWGARIIGNICVSNGQNTTTSNPHTWGKSGINTQGRVQSIIISNNVCFSGSGADQDYGIKLLPGTNNDVNITGNICTNNATGGIDITQSTEGNVQTSNNIV